MLAGRVMEANPATVEEAIERAKAIERGYNFSMSNMGLPEMGSIQNIFAKPLEEDAIDKLTKQMEEMKLAML